ncbi:MAG: Ni/Fe-hydrogenase cytochrome b subunit [Proteobacteria bacterium]|nr:Ni/Fe-hydrogenase cytochrome b subunit [Pseudomonadota bacterium]
MAAQENKNIQLMSGGGKVLLALVGLFGVAALYRLATGLGAATNLNDDYPWGLWIAMDVMAGVALAAGGFAIAAAVYIFNMKKYKPIVRPAILTAYFGYLLVAVGIFFDIGKPHTLWHPLFMWQPHSVMFEVVMCVVMYLAVLTFEFAPTFFEGTGRKDLAEKLHSRPVLFFLVIAGITLSFFHQSSLGGLFLLMPSKLHHLWWTTLLPYNFYISAIAAGLAMVSFETVLAAKIFKHDQEKEILQGLATGTAVTLLIYLVMRLGDIVAKGNLGLAFEGSTASMLFLLEIVGGAIVPMILLAIPAIKKSIPALFITQLLVILGVVMNRFSVTFLAQGGGNSTYFPSFVEISITVGLIALLMFLYRASVIKLPVFSHAKTEK